MSGGRDVKKNILSLVMGVFICIAVLPVSVFAASNPYPQYKVRMATSVRQSWYRITRMGECRQLV